VCRVVIVDEGDLIGCCGDDGIRATLDYDEIAERGYPRDAALGRPPVSPEFRSPISGRGLPPVDSVFGNRKIDTAVIRT
jgi:hypothetical protein